MLPFAYKCWQMFAPVKKWNLSFLFFEDFMLRLNPFFDIFQFLLAMMKYFNPILIIWKIFSYFETFEPSISIFNFLEALNRIWINFNNFWKIWTILNLFGWFCTIYIYHICSFKNLSFSFWSILSGSEPVWTI